MFLLDDILLRQLGLAIQPFDMLWYLELMRDYALREKYNLKEINNKIKANRLLFEIGEMTKEDYEEKHKLLIEERERAEEIIENLSDVQIAEVRHNG